MSTLLGHKKCMGIKYVRVEEFCEMYLGFILSEIHFLFDQNELFIEIQ